MSRQLDVALFALLSVAFLVASHYFLRRAAKKLGHVVVRSLVRSVRPILTVYYRRKVIRQVQAERKAKGLPPLENLHIL